MTQPELRPEAREGRQDPTPVSLWSLILGSSIAVVFAAFVGYLVFLFVLETYEVVPAEAARTAVTLIGVPTAAGAVFVALRSLRLKEKQLHTDQVRLADAARNYDLAFDSEHTRRKVDQERELRSRYVSAADQMGNESAAVRLAGVNAMAQLADDWAEQRQSCVDVLCAYLRLPQLRTADGKLSASDGEVRRTVQRLIGQGFRRSKGPEGGHRWADVELDLRGAILRDFHMPQLLLGRASFIDATFLGRTTFIGSKFQDAAFRNAAFNDTVTFAGCEFDRVSFYLTKFRGAARFKNTVFTGMVTFGKAEFGSGLDLSGVTSKRKIRFDETSFSTEPVRDGADYELTLRNCVVRGSRIEDVNVLTTLHGLDGELQNLDDEE